MFESKYNRLKFWIISFSLLIILVFVNFFAKLFADIGQNNNAIFLYGISLVISLSWINTLANRIRDYGSNPWLALWALLPLVNIVLAFYYGIVKTKNKEIKTEEVDSNTSLPKAVYNHSKDIVNEIKPAINEYKEKHSTTKDENQITETINSEITEDEIYEKIMIEIEENKKVKSTWAKALSQSEGDDKKANSLYINLRVQEIKIELENLQKQRALEIQLQKQIEKEEQKANEIKKATATIYNLEEIENYGYSFISKNTVRKNGSWNDFDLIYDETLDIYFVKNNAEIVDAFYLKG